MKIKKINIENYRSIKDIHLDLRDNLNVFVGINGSGKTTILDAISTSLSWLVNRIQRLNSSGNHISETDIRNETSSSSIELCVTENEKDFNWNIIKTARGTNITEKSELNEVTGAFCYSISGILSKGKEIASYCILSSYQSSR